MVSMFLHRRDVLAYYEEPAPTGPLYPFPTIESGPLAGTGGQRVVCHHTAATNAGVYNNKITTTTSAYSSSVEVFSIPEGASYALTAEIRAITSAVGLSNAGFYLKNSTNNRAITLTAPDGSNITGVGTYTVTGVTERAYSVGEFGFRLTRVNGITDLDMTITLTVNGVRYI